MELNRNDLQTLDSIIKRSKSLARYQALYEVAKSFVCLFAVRSGTFKTTLTTTLAVFIGCQPV
ncbi:MAG TPA: hypothetical protein VFM76_05920 [Methylophaga sp.]|nr:hypothetical protein [Methylophaga sp.]